MTVTKTKFSFLAAAVSAVGLLASSCVFAGEIGTGAYVSVGIGYQQFFSPWNATRMRNTFGDPVDSFDETAKVNFDSGHAVGNISLGFDKVFDSFLIGSELMADLGSKKKDFSGIPGCAGSGCIGAQGPGRSSSFVKVREGVQYIVRAGWLPEKDTAIYGLSGVVFRRVTTSQTCFADAPDPVCYASDNLPRQVSNSRTLRGFVLGAGVQKKFDKFSFKLEYREERFGKFNEIAEFHDPADATYGHDSKLSTRTIMSGIVFDF